MSPIDKIPGSKLFTVLLRQKSGSDGKVEECAVLWRRSQACAAKKAQSAGGGSLKGPEAPAENVSGADKHSLRAQDHPMELPAGEDKRIRAAADSLPPAQRIELLRGSHPPVASVGTPSTKAASDRIEQPQTNTSLSRATREFEAVFLRYLASAFRRTVGEAQAGTRIPGSKLYDGLIDEQLASLLASRDGSLVELMSTQLSKREGVGDDVSS